MPLEELLNNSPWMSGLNAAEQSKVRSDIVIKNIPADEFVCRRGQLAEHWYGVVNVSQKR